VKGGCNFEPNSDNTGLKNEIMKKTALILAFALSAAAPLFADGTNNTLTDEKSRLSYSIGMMFANRWKEQGVDVDPNLVLRGMKDQQSGGPTLMSQQEMHDLINKFQNALADRQQKMRDQLLAKNKADGEAFLAKNKTQPGVVTLPDGLQYKVLTDGNGEIPGPDDIATLNYRGTFVDGTEFGSSAQDGKPLELAVGKIFRGWSEALRLMKTGSKWQLFIPAELAYGQGGMGSRIPPNSTLLIEVELISVKHPKSQQQPAFAPPPSAGAPLTSDIIKVPSAEERARGAQVEIIKSGDVQKLQQPQPQPAN
jgi:FKBP-type peptidyl-prolyl cis-trans isomerase FklB